MVNFPPPPPPPPVQSSRTRSALGRFFRVASLLACCAIAGCQQSMAVLFSRLAAGRAVVHVLDGGCPGDGFEPARPDLEHVYFASLQGR